MPHPTHGVCVTAHPEPTAVTLLLKGKLLFARNIVVTSVPHHLRR